MTRMSCGVGGYAGPDETRVREVTGDVIGGLSK